MHVDAFIGHLTYRYALTDSQTDTCAPHACNERVFWLVKEASPNIQAPRPGSNPHLQLTSKGTRETVTEQRSPPCAARTACLCLIS
jgi:hypothetical protein